jgi:hypothetical protein
MTIYLLQVPNSASDFAKKIERGPIEYPRAERDFEAFFEQIKADFLCSCLPTGGRATTTAF